MKIQKKKSKKELEAEATRWIKAGKLIESPELMAISTPLNPKKHRQLLGAGNRKPISIRIPENDLEAIRRIAKMNGRKYQRLIVQAVQLYIDNYYLQIKAAQKANRNHYFRIL